MKYFSENKSHGFTLIELLVSITVLTIVIALVVPRLRVASKERNIRETARLVGATISSARDRAVNDGVGGFVIQRNLNFVSNTSDGNQVYFAGTRLIELRATPPYFGDADGDVAYVVLVQDGTGASAEFFLRCFIPRPAEHQDAVGGRKVVRPNDRIQFGSNATFSIAAVLESQGDFLPVDLAFQVDVNTSGGVAVPNLTVPDQLSGFLRPALSQVDADEQVVTLSDALDVMADTDIATQRGLPFEVIRRPRRIQHSSVDLPPGYIIDLRYSGPVDDGATELANPEIGIDDLDTHTFFGTALADVDTDDEDDLNNEQAIFNQEIVVIFDKQGALDAATSTTGFGLIPGDSIQLFVTEYDPSEIGIGETPFQTAERELSNPDSLWVNVGINGNVNVSSNSPPLPGTATVPAMLNQARALSRIRVSAVQ